MDVEVGGEVAVGVLGLPQDVKNNASPTVIVSMTLDDLCCMAVASSSDEVPLEAQGLVSERYGHNG
jgi:hypothetical protein